MQSVYHLDNKFTIFDLECKIPQEFVYSMDKYQVILDILQKNLGDHKRVSVIMEIVRQNPEILVVFLGELEAAIYKFNRMKNESLVKNADKLMRIMGTDNLPECSVIVKDLLKGNKSKKKLAQLFEEMNKFKFLDDKTSNSYLLGRILVALYRTYLLQNISGLRGKGAQVASALEEMLAVMALNGFHTHLFQATRHWIIDWKKEGFSRELAEKISRIKD